MKCDPPQNKKNKKGLTIQPKLPVTDPKAELKPKPKGVWGGVERLSCKFWPICVIYVYYIRTRSKCNEYIELELKESN